MNTNENASLASLTLTALTALYAQGVDDYAPAGFAPVDKFKRKADAIERIEAMCASGNVAVAFDGESAVIVDATPEPSDDDATDDDATDDDATDDDATDDDATDDAPNAPRILADGMGALRPWNVKLAGEAWLKANARGTPSREAYRKERRKAARMARKAARKAKADAREAADAE